MGLTLEASLFVQMIVFDKIKDLLLILLLALTKAFI